MNSLSLSWVCVLELRLCPRVFLQYNSRHITMFILSLHEASRTLVATFVIKFRTLSEFLAVGSLIQVYYVMWPTFNAFMFMDICPTFLCKLNEKRYYNLSENKPLERNETLELIVMEWLLLCDKTADSGIYCPGHHFCTVCCLCELLLDKRPYK